LKRAKTDSYILELKLKTNYSQEKFLEKCFKHAARMYNQLVRYARRQLKKLKNDKEYQKLLSLYIKAEDKSPEKKELSKKLKDKVVEYNLTQYQLEAFIKVMRKPLSKYISSNVGQRIAAAVAKGVESVLYSDGNTLHFKKWDDINSFEGKDNGNGIRFDGKCVYIMQYRNRGGIAVPIVLPKNKSSQHYIYETTCLCDKTKYCRIVRRRFNNGWHYYLQLIQEGAPPTKNTNVAGCVGIDIGTSTVAVVSETECVLKSLGEGIDVIEKEMRLLQRKMDRSKRTSNPGNYNPDGTIKKGRKKWIYSKNYRKLKNKHANLSRKRKARLKQSHEVLANKLLSLGNEFYIEKMNFKALAKKTKKTEQNTKGRFKSKKRFGKSIQTRAPAMFVGILKRKANVIGATVNEVNTKAFKASQYDHITDTYTKKPLSRRYHLVGGETQVQRDLYSAFLLQNSDNSLEHSNRKSCIETFDRFLKLHDECINAIRTTQTHMPTSFGISVA